MFCRGRAGSARLPECRGRGPGRGGGGGGGGGERKNICRRRRKRRSPEEIYVERVNRERGVSCICENILPFYPFFPFFSLYSPPLFHIPSLYYHPLQIAFLNLPYLLLASFPFYLPYSLFLRHHFFLNPSSCFPSLSIYISYLLLLLLLFFLLFLFLLQQHHLLGAALAPLSRVALMATELRINNTIFDQREKSI